MAVTDVSEQIKKRRKKKKTAQFLKKLLVILAVASAALAIVMTRSLWYPKLNGILTKIPTAENTSELAEGYFPLLIEGGTSYQLSNIDNGICILDDSRFFTYNIDGKSLFTAQHTFANPVLTTSSRKALIYDLGGKSFQLMTKYKQVYELRTESPILLSKLSSNDYAAVVTKSDKFMASLMIYDADGNNIFNYSSIDRIIDVCFSKNNDGCYITTIGSSGGVLVTNILYYKFNKVDYDEIGNPVPVWKTDYIDTLSLSVKLFGDDKIIVVGDTKCVCFDINGTALFSYEYDSTLKDYEISSKIVSMIFDDTERRTSTLVTVDSTANKVDVIPLDYTAINTDCDGETVYVHSKSEITAYNSVGDIVSDVSLYADYDDFNHINNYIFLLGYDEINRIDFK